MWIPHRGIVWVNNNESVKASGKNYVMLTESATGTCIMHYLCIMRTLSYSSCTSRVNVLYVYEYEYEYKEQLINLMA